MEGSIVVSARVTQAQKELIDALASAECVTRASLIREAVAALVQRRVAAITGTGADDHDLLNKSAQRVSQDDLPW